MNQNTFLELLEKQKFPAPVVVVREHSLFLDHHAHQYEVMALVIEGQIDINIGGAKKNLFGWRYFPPFAEPGSYRIHRYKGREISRKQKSCQSRGRGCCSRAGNLTTRSKF